MKRSDPAILAIQEFKSQPGDAGVAIGCVVWDRCPDSSADGYVVHSFIHNGGQDPELQRFWGHYQLDLKRAMNLYLKKAQHMVDKGYEPYRFDPDSEHLLEAEKLAKEYEGNVDRYDLDELVHKLAAAQTAGINNAGLAEQIAFLLQHLGSHKAVVEKLKEALPEPIAEQRKGPDGN